MGLLTRDQILAVIDFPEPERVAVPEWGGDVLVRVMTGAERDRFEQDLFRCQQQGRPLDNMRARLLAACLVDDKGQLLFSPEDVQALGRKSGLVLDRLFDVVQRVNLLRQSDVEGEVKNSAAGRNGSSTSASPSPSA